VEITSFPSSKLLVEVKMKVLNLFSILSLLGSYTTAGIVMWDTQSSLDPWARHGFALCFNVCWSLTVFLMWIQLATTPRFTDVEKQFVFYASYHDNFPNQLIHIVFVWPILITALMFLTWTTYATVVISGLTIHLLSLAFALVYAVYYFYLEQPVGILASCFVMVAWISAERLKQHHELELAPVIFSVHVVSWVAQFVGHIVFEGRAPALLDNLAQSFFMAPLFVLLETVSWCGYKKAIFEGLKGEVHQNIVIFKEGGSVTVHGGDKALLAN